MNVGAIQMKRDLGGNMIVVAPKAAALEGEPKKAVSAKRPLENKIKFDPGQGGGSSSTGTEAESSMPANRSSVGIERVG
jgi:hypothetical protein